jgi:uncharacterized phage protein (TIGR01671 family)
MNDKFEELKQNLLPRFWDTENKEMIYNKFNNNTLGVEFFYYENKRGFARSLYSLLVNPRFIPMKPTGLKDKNGKLIYEGDIIARESIEIGDIFQSFTGAVEFTQAQYFITDNENKISAPLFDEIAEIKIIGNIHENSDLLK